MMYQVQYRRSPEETWQNYARPVVLYMVDSARAQCHYSHPNCEVRVVPDAQPSSWDDRRRWELEKGEGSDHDKPYRYEPPFDGKTRDAWLRLAARWHRGEFTEDGV